MDPILPDFDLATFEPGAIIDNPYFPLPLGRILSYEAEEDEEEEDDNDIEDMEDDDEDEDDDGINGDLETEEDSFPSESNQVIATFDTKNIQVGGTEVQAVVVRDVAWEDGILVEDTFDWYAQDTEGNVWYLGELSTNYEYDNNGNFLGTNTEGSWEAGVDGALPGYIMKANPQVGDSYYQEFFLGVAEDEAEVISLTESISIDFGDFDNVLKTREFTALEPDVFEFKYDAPGIGEILAEEDITEEGGEPGLSSVLVGISNLANISFPALSTTTFENSEVIDNIYFPLNPGTFTVYQGEETDSETGETELERHEVVVTHRTLDILGITSRVVQDQEFDDGLLVDETLSYYAQDTDGNVWILGQSITEYEYDEAGNLIEIDDDESWLAGEGQSLPGLIMEATPETGEAYYQRFDIGEAEDQAEIVNSNISVSLDSGDFTNVVQIKEFSVLEPDEFDNRYYAAGVGQILTEEIDEDGEVSLASELIESRDVGLFDTSIYRFQNTNLPGTYLYVGSEEARNVRTDFSGFDEEGLAFRVSVQSGDDLIAFYRFQSIQTPGTYLYAAAEERASIQANFADSYTEEGLAFYAYGVGTGLGTEVYRFQNILNPGTYLFATGSEVDDIRANFPNYVEEGVAFEAVI